MKASINPAVEVTPLYPYIVSYDIGVIVLLFGEREGVVLHSLDQESHPVGDYCVNWATEGRRVYRGTVTLSN